MSAFLVSNETINRVVHLLDLDGCGYPRHAGSENNDKLGNDLWQLNDQAVNYRYWHRSDLAPHTQIYSWSPRNYTAWQMLKAADCWLYQCSEGEQFENSILYQQVERARDQAMRRIVTRMEAYEKVEWDAPHNSYCVGTNPVAVKGGAE